MERADSDVDIGLLLTTPPAATLDGQPFDLADALERHLGRSVDVIGLNTSPADLRMRVLRDGHLVFEGNASARVRFDVATRQDVLTNRLTDLVAFVAAVRARAT